MFDFLSEWVKNYNKEYNYLKSLTILNKDAPLIFQKPWFNIQKKGEFIPAHTHEGVLSYSIWIQIPKLNSHNNKFAGCFEIQYQKRLKSYQDYPVGRAIASLTTKEKTQATFPLKNAVQVQNLAVKQDYRGQGLAQFMYDVLLNQLKYVLVAGDSQTVDGQRAWLNLAKNPDVNVSGFYFVSDSEIKNNPRIIDSIMALGGKRLGKPLPGYTKDKFYCFTFPLKFGRQRLSPVKLNNLS